jgi:DNA repair protein SbcD/Mre11
MRVLHTSDWHLGKTLYAKKDRQAEHTAFFEWLLKTIRDKKVDALIVAGDIFDTASPSSTSQKMYYDFLITVKTAGCSHVIVVGGNHDSPSFLNAPKDILSALNVSVIGNATEDLEDELVIVKNLSGEAKLIVCGVPFLRERDISRYADGESYSDRSKRVNECIKNHYEEIAQLAEKKRKELGGEIPIIATGHLSVAGGKRNEDDGVRDTYIGTVEAVGFDIFPDTFDYVALGHYHIPSEITEHIRYCGSPIPMGFGEVGQKKRVYLIDYTQERKIETIYIPIFQELESIKGKKEYIEERLTTLKKESKSVWVEVIYTGNELFPDFTSWVNELIADTLIEVLKLQNRQHLNTVLTKEDSYESLEELNVVDVFDKKLVKEHIIEEEKEALKELYNQVVQGLTIVED